MTTLRLSQDRGSLSIRTTVEGRAARMGHRLTIEIAEWEAEVQLDGDRPMSASLTAKLESLQVVSGDGGVTPISPVDRAAIKHNALKSTHADKHPDVRYDVDEFDAVDGGYDVRGTLTINGITRPHGARVDASETDAGWVLHAVTPVVHSDFAIKPYSLMVGALRVGDEVSIEFKASLEGLSATDR